MSAVMSAAHRAVVGGRIEDTAMFQAHIDPRTSSAQLLESVAAGADRARAVYLRLRRGGLDAAEAGNLTARVNGLAPVASGWRIDEIERLLFLRWRDEQGRVPH